MHVEWTGSPTLHLEVAWREAQGDEWTVVGPDDFSWHLLRDLEPATTYEAKARHWHHEMGYGPWSKIYQITSADEPPLLVVCEVPIKGIAISDEDITHISSWEPTYLGMFGSYHTTGVIRFTNPESEEWEYGFRIRALWGTVGDIVVSSDGTWEERKGSYVYTSGTLPSIDPRPGATNEVLYSTRGGVWGYYHGLWVNGEWVEFDGPSGRWIDLIVVQPEKVNIPVKRIRWEDGCE